MANSFIKKLTGGNPLMNKKARIRWQNSAPPISG